MYQIPAVLSEVLLLVSGEIHQVHKQKCLHYGMWCIWLKYKLRICNVESFELNDVFGL